MNERFRPYFAAYLVLLDGEQVLLHQRKGSGYMDGFYSLVSGHFEGRETVREAIMREGQEEADMNLKPEDLEVVHVMHRLAPDREYIDVYLTVRQWEGEPKNMEPDRCEELRWFPLHALPENMVPEIRQALLSIEQGEFYGEFGWEKRV